MKKDKDIEEEVKKEIEKLSSEEIREKLKYSYKLLSIGRKTIFKRKEETIGERFGEELDTVLSFFMVLLIFGIIYLGAVPTYFGVNNEMLNPTNSSFGINNSILVAGEAGAIFLTRLVETGMKSPTFFFWFWWIMVISIFILPLINIITWFWRKYVTNKKR
jgi:hypothetical protein